jgi:hypothetical protein
VDLFHGFKTERTGRWSAPTNQKDGDEMTEKKKSRETKTANPADKILVEFWADCEERRVWEQRTWVRVPEGTTKKQLDALGKVLLENESELNQYGHFLPINEVVHTEASTVHEILFDDEGSDGLGYESFECRLNKDGEWEIGGVHWYRDDESADDD